MVSFICILNNNSVIKYTASKYKTGKIGSIRLSRSSIYVLIFDNLKCTVYRPTASNETEPGYRLW